jgi:hypothetical protein
MDMFKEAIQSDKLTVYEKKDLFTGLRYSFLAGKTKPSEILELASVMRQTNDDAIIESLANRIGEISTIFIKETDRNHFDAYANSVAHPLLDKIGIESDLNESSERSFAREELLHILKNDENIRRSMIEIANKYMSDDRIITWKTYIYLFFSIYYEGTSVIYQKIMNRLENSKDPTERIVLSFCLGSFKEDSLVQKSLDYSINSKIKPLESLAIVIALQQKYRFEDKNKKNVLPWFQEHYSFFKENISTDDLDSFYLTMFIHNDDDLKLFNQLFPKEERSKILNKSIVAKAEEIKRQRELRNLYTDDLNKYLKNFTARY